VLAAEFLVDDLDDPCCCCCFFVCLACHIRTELILQCSAACLLLSAVLASTCEGKPVPAIAFVAVVAAAAAVAACCCSRAGRRGHALTFLAAAGAAAATSFLLLPPQRRHSESLRLCL